MSKSGANGNARGVSLDAEGSKGKSKSRPFNARKMDSLGSSNRQAKPGSAGTPPKTAGKKKSSQARKSRR
jgi:hypothetical protein